MKITKLLSVGAAVPQALLQTGQTFRRPTNHRKESTMKMLSTNKGNGFNGCSKTDCACGAKAAGPRLSKAGVRIAAAVFFSVIFALPRAASAQPGVPVVKGKTEGIWYWTLPNTPNGLIPSQSWSGASAAPNGDIYIAGMDHTTNSALYRVHADVLSNLGDARAASEAVGNWQPGEIAEKFHTRPVWLGDKVFVATLSSSTLDAAYLGLRGFHWYAYKTLTNQFVDLSASQPGRVGAEHGGLIAIVADDLNKIIYGALSPTGDIYRHDPVSGGSTKIGRPDYKRQYVYPGRALWVGGQGRVYFSAGNDDEAYYATPYDPGICNHIHYYDPATKTFGERKDWNLHNQRAIDSSRCFAPSGVCFLMDNVGHIYKFEGTGPKWTYLGNIGQDSSRVFGYAWVFQVSDDQKKAYIGTQSGWLFEFDLTTGKVSFSVNLKEIEPNLASKSWIYGYNAYVASRFYFAAFNPTGNAQLVAIDPVRLKAAVAKGPSLYVSKLSSRATPVLLQGAAVSGNAYVFTAPDTQVARVEFGLDGSPVRTESLAPFDFGGTLAGGAAGPFNTSVLTPGSHNISARATMTNGTAQMTSASFTVAGLYLSYSPTRSTPTPLDGRLVSPGNIYVFTSPDTGVLRVQFWLDGRLVKAENLGPFDFVGTSGDGTALPFNVVGLASGAHVIRAQLTMNDGSTSTVTSTFYR